MELDEKARMTGDLEILKKLCKDHGLDEIVDRIEKGEIKPQNTCTGSSCQTNCTYACMGDCTFMR